ncbi:hypothetical protein [Sphingomonas crocodyli]|uniref:Uncharacterized protein n=1 Tax=Sphingomonas crocodyli TaxID=1979270 RepID=A0A437M6V9_9SPHN|nr:hypothetical protein [Sphingomonas crocodyli]RVT93448.1 hypothetical protein EOD43_06115 [Sphingomonas crocodyli]
MSKGKVTISCGGFGSTAQAFYEQGSVRYEVTLRTDKGDEVQISSVEQLTLEDLGEALKFQPELRIDADVLSQIVVRDVRINPIEMLACPHSIWLDALLEPATAEDIQANLEDVYMLWVNRHGERRARWIYRGQVLRTIAGLWVTKALDLLERTAHVVKQLGGA